MFKKMRYGMVILAAAAILTIVLALTQNAKLRRENAARAEESFRVQDISAEMMGNPLENESVKAESTLQENTISGTDDTVSKESDPETQTSDMISSETVDDADETSEDEAEADCMTAEETVQEETLRLTADTAETTETETAETETAETETVEESVQAADEDSEPHNALRAYFADRLIIDPEKVALYLNVREEPDEDAKILSVLYPRDISRIVGVNGSWYMIQCDGYIGYVSSECVLTGDQAYEAVRHNVAYAAMAREDSVFLYNQPDASSDVILAAAKSDFFRVVGVSGQYFEVAVSSPLYDTLYVRMEDTLLFYLFLGPGNDNELDEEKEAYFEQFDIADNLKKAMVIQAEAASERASYESEEARLREESAEAELALEIQQKKEISEAISEAAGEAAGQNETPAAETAQEPADQGSESEATDGKKYLGTFTITGYCHCRECCGAWGSNDPEYKAHGSSGMPLQDGYSVAVDIAQIPYGTRLLINGKEYIAADTGVGFNHIDIYHKYHSDAESVGMYLAEVYILP